MIRNKTMNCKDKFRAMYHKEAESIAFCPYRICPIGAHSDTNLGKVTGLAIDRGIHIAYSPKLNGVVELCSLQFDKRAQWHVLQVSQKKENDWADYLRGATLILSSRFPLKRGISGVIEGSLPIGGLSSSAAVVLAFLEAICDVNCISLTPLEMIRISVQVENEYVGVSCGKLDQSCEIYSRQSRLLYLDTRDDSYELIPFGQPQTETQTGQDNLPFDIAIFFSGLERNLSGSRFNQRVDEARAAAYALMAYDGRDYGKFREANLRDIPVETFLRYRDRLPENWAKRADHWYSEFDRVEKGVEAWRNGNIEEYGRLSFESGRSSIYSWETGSPELKALYEIMTHTDGIYGGRFSGAGFKGCCMALIDPRYTESIERNVGEEYLRLFPELKGKYSFHLCHSADGLHF